MVEAYEEAVNGIGFYFLCFVSGGKVYILFKVSLGLFLGLCAYALLFFYARSYDTPYRCLSFRKLPKTSIGRNFLAKLGLTLPPTDNKSK